MKISFKIPTIAALGGLVLCAGVLSASANGAASADKAAVYALYENEKPFEHSVGVVEYNGLPDWNYYHQIENPVVLTEYPDKLLPYVEELELINAKLGMDYEICKAFPNDEEAEYMVDFISSMSIEKFRELVYEGYEEEMEYSLSFDRHYSDETTEADDTASVTANDDTDGGTMGVVEIKGFGGVIKHRGGFWYFEDLPETHYYPENDHRSEGAVISKDGGIVGVIPNADPTGSYDEESPYEAPEFSTAGIYRGDGRVYPCD